MSAGTCVACCDDETVALTEDCCVCDVDKGTESVHSWSQTRMDVPFWGPHNCRQHLGVHISPKNVAIERNFAISSVLTARMKNNIIEE